MDLVSKGTNGNGVKLDFFCIVEREDIHEITVTQTKRNVIPDIEETGHTTKYRYHYHEKEIGLTGESGWTYRSVAWIATTAERV